jgi:hypothetical protein
VSTHGGDFPRWRGDGKELFYISADNKLVATAVEASGYTLTWQGPRPLFPVAPGAEAGRYAYDVSADGRRFLVLQQAEKMKSQPLIVVVNWQAALPK